MRRRVWSVEEIEGIMRAMHERNGMAPAAAPQGSSAVCSYEQGYNAALVTLAIALGLVPRDTGADSGSSLSRGEEPELGWQRG